MPPRNVVVRLFENINSPELCQSLCNANKKCKWFNWGNPREANDCLLLSQKPINKTTIPESDKGATGPNNCKGGCATRVI